MNLKKNGLYSGYFLIFLSAHNWASVYSLALYRQVFLVVNVNIIINIIDIWIILTGTKSHVRTLSILKESV